MMRWQRIELALGLALPVAAALAASLYAQGAPWHGHHRVPAPGAVMAVHMAAPSPGRIWREGQGPAPRSGRG